jgi:hypothetical protein
MSSNHLGVRANPKPLTLKQPILADSTSGCLKVSNDLSLTRSNIRLVTAAETEHLTEGDRCNVHLLHKQHSTYSAPWPLVPLAAASAIAVAVAVGAVEGMHHESAANHLSNVVKSAQTQHRLQQTCPGKKPHPLLPME